MNKTLTFEFNIDQTNLIIAALVRMPYETVAPLVAEVQKQAQAQMGDQMRSMPVPPSEKELK